MLRMVSTNQLGSAIRDLRWEQGLTQQELADKSGVSRWWVVQLERGKATVEAGKVFRVLECLGKSLSIDESHPDILAAAMDEIPLESL